jgi:hypothetical protein
MSEFIYTYASFISFSFLSSSFYDLLFIPGQVRLPSLEQQKADFEWEFVAVDRWCFLNPDLLLGRQNRLLEVRIFRGKRCNQAWSQGCSRMRLGGAAEDEVHASL